MRFVEVQPRESHVAMLSVAFDGADLLNSTVGSIWFEVFPIESVDELVQYASQVAQAVIHGRVEEWGLPRLWLTRGVDGVQAARATC